MLCVMHSNAALFVGWHRVLVIRVDEATKSAAVKYVDFGGYTNTDWSQLYNIRFFICRTQIFTKYGGKLQRRLHNDALSSYRLLPRQHCPNRR